MRLSDAIQQLQYLASQDLKGGDCEVILYDTNSDIEYRARPEDEEIDFWFARGDGEIVIEFKGGNR